jgi:hypothetical protein
MQILFKDEAYRSLIDMTTDISLESKFREIENVMIKHGTNITVFQYADDTVQGLSTAQPERLMFSRRTMELMSKMGFPGESVGLDPTTVAGRTRLEAMMSAVENLWSMFQATGPLGDVLAGKPPAGAISSGLTVSSSRKAGESKGKIRRNRVDER